MLGSRINGHWITCFLFSILSYLVNAQTSVNNIVIQGDPATFNCYDASSASQYDGYYVVVKYKGFDSTAPEIEIARYKPAVYSKSMRDPNYQARVDFLTTGEIQIKYISLKDEGTYTCTGQDFLAEETVISNNIIVYVKPVLEVKKSPGTLVAGEGLSSAAQCSAIGGKPPAIVKWKTDRHLEFEQVPENRSESAELTTVMSTLHIKPTKFYNNQAFYCTVSHPTMPVMNQTVFILNVTYAPDPPTIKVSEDHTMLTCTSNGNPTPTIQWRLPASAATPYHTGPTVALVSPNDPNNWNDTYICTAKNGVLPDMSTNITAREASTYVEMEDVNNVTMIIGIVIGCLLFLLLVVGIVYYFIIRPTKDGDNGPYKERDDVQHYPYNIEREGSGYGGRPLIEHQNASLNKNRPPSPQGPPPANKDNRDDDSSGSETDEGNHDVDLEVVPATNLNDPDSNEGSGITSRASVNFQARRKRPSTSPGSRRSRHEPQMKRDSPVQRHPPRYDSPPGEDYELDTADHPLVQDDYNGYEEDGYRDQYNHPPNYGSRYPQPQQQQPPRRTDSLPQYEPKYSEIDHTSYKKNANPQRPQYNEPIEYAQIRHGYSHVV